MTKRPQFLFYLIAVAGSLFLSSCQQIDVFEKNTKIPAMKWQNNFPATGSFSIGDTTASYNLYLVIRHTDAYLYNNIWVNVGLQSPGDSLFFQKLDLSLGSDANGWEGTGMNDIWEVRKPLAQNRRFRKTGEYRFSIYHVMRDNPLLHIMSVGMRVEKVS